MRKNQKLGITNKVDQKKHLNELICLFRFDEIIRSEKTTIDEILANSTQYIINCCGYPDITGAQITYQGKKFKTDKFKKTKWVLKIPIQINAEILGNIEVCFQNNPKTIDPREKDKEEFFINEIAHRLGYMISRRLLEEALSESEKKYYMLIEQFNDATYLLHNGKFELVNKRFVEMFGYSEEELDTADFKFLNIVAPKSLPMMRKRMGLVRKGKDVPSIYEFTAIKKEGSEIECEASVSYINYQSGIATQGIIRDITERKESERRLIETKEQLSSALRSLRDNQDKLLKIQKLKSMQELAAGIAHEFAQPLQVLTNYLDLLEIEKKDSPYIKKCIQMVNRIAELTKNLRHLTTLEKKEYVDTEIMDLKASSGNQKESKDRRVLILDDEQEILNTMMEMFEAYGYKCDGALNGSEGLKLVSNNNYWLIVSDVMMPEMSGPEFFRQIQKQGNYAHFVFLTGYEIPESEKHTITKADAVLTKPISFDNLFNTIEDITAKKTA